MIVLSHATALECMRLYGLSGAFASGGVRTELPTKTPPVAEVLATLSLGFSASFSRPIHLLASGANAKRTTRAVVVHAGVAPTGLVRVGKGVYCVPPELLVMQLARECSDVELAMLLTELLGTFAVQPQLQSGMFVRKRPIMSVESLGQAIALRGYVRGTRRVEKTLSLVAPGAASIMEGKLRARVAWPPSLGGFGLPVKDFNLAQQVPRLATGDRNERLFDLPLGVDAVQIDLEYHGALHRSASVFNHDIYRQNDLTAAGVTQYAIGKEQYDNMAYFEELMKVIRCQLGMCPQEVDADQEERERTSRQMLYEALERADGLTCFGLANPFGEG